MKIIMSDNDVKRSINRMAHEIIEKNSPEENNLVIIGIQTRGVSLSKRIADKINQILSSNLSNGQLDVTPFRDDLQRGIVRKVTQSQIPDIENKVIVLVDDVLQTGRTCRSALNALMSYGRPKQIQLAVLIDRGHRELPIKADYVGKNVPTSLHSKIKVVLAENDNVDKDSVIIIEV